MNFKQQTKPTMSIHKDPETQSKATIS